jgi:hypothetical protein
MELHYAERKYDDRSDKIENSIPLEDQNSNITTQLAFILKTSEDFRLVQQIREEIEKMKPSLALAV